LSGLAIALSPNLQNTKAWIFVPSKISQARDDAKNAFFKKIVVV